ncbi:uncharacterized protein PV06_01460 [Exophiala oligosperma]|uniref:Xylulose 5-phosphate/Fructose 6-phosphate phosphoketolase N-terminal domain-containing protein n=1 Tax=Exophiala oligosperma TaxID=215243 RepID=A0A0D2B9M0_9EURO|nr:uncharacterized protein PV06_01460 [Exophiala oligosperma]KIW48901.1 hypothetical protein PV06_01460 [Exophiala oligosperma]
MATNDIPPQGRDRRVSISQLPDDALKLGKNLYPEPLHFKTTAHLAEFRRAADYISAAMIFLRDNVLLERDLSPEDIKHIIGYWGVSPGITLLYAHINLTIQKYDQPMICLLGANYGVPAILSCLWLERSLERFYPQYSRDRKGLHNLITGFSVPGGFPSHISARIPGCIFEGGELGHVLSVAYGTIMDRPELITVAVIGDGEAETGPTATAWHMCKYINPTQDGALLPILYMSSAEDKQQTIFGSMDDAELCCLFSGYGYRPCIVDDVADIDRELSSALYWAVEVIKEIQLAAKAGEHDLVKPRWPIIILRISRRWGYPLLDPDEHLSGSFHGREVLLPHAKINQKELQHLQDWLKSYKPAEIFQGDQVSEAIEDIIPPNERLLLGQNRVTWDMRHQLDVPEWRHYAVARGNLSSCLKEGGRYLDDTLARNKLSLRIFSPDGLVSNKLNLLDKLSDRTFRSFRWDANNKSTGEQVIEFASEHTCQGLLQGYTMTGLTGIFAADESLFPSIATMMVQYGKFLRTARDTGWRQDLNSLTYIPTSTWTRPEPNGFSHQNPSFIGSVLNLKPTIGRVYLPPDANTFLCTLAHCLRSKNYVNLIVPSSHPGPVWFGPEEAEFHCRAGGGVLKWASTDDGIDPDVVLVGIGADATFEVLAASAHLRRLAPAMSVRVVNVTDLMILGREGSHPHSLGHRDFDILFTPHRDIHFNYHGYASELQGLLFGRPHLDRVSISSFQNEVTTMTPFETMLKNKCSRYHVAEAAIRGAAKCNPHIAVDLQKLVAHVQHERAKLEQFIEKHGVDPAGIYDAPKFSKPWHRHRQPNGDEDWSSHDRSFHVPRGTD